MWRLDIQGENRERTDDREEAQVQIARQDACRKFPKEGLKEAGDGVWVPVLIGCEQVHITLCELVKVKG